MSLAIELRGMVEAFRVASERISERGSEGGAAAADSCADALEETLDRHDVPRLADLFVDADAARAILKPERPA